MSRRRAIRLAAALVLALDACGGERGRANDSASGSRGAGADQALVVFNAGSLARPLRAALDTFARRERVRIDQENAGSLESARKLTELGKIPDLIALADYEVFPQVLMPAHVAWYARFARNRMVLAYADRSRGATGIDSTNWWRVLQRPDVVVGRSDPNLDPNGYRTLLVMQLAERYYRQPGLAARLLAVSPASRVRPKEADLIGLLQAGEFDYIWSYESIARGAGLRFVALPSAIDLGSATDSAFYATAATRVAGATPRDTLTIRGQPILYALSIPRLAPHPLLAQRLAAFLLSAEGTRILRAQQLDALASAEIVGADVPPTVAAAVVR